MSQLYGRLLVFFLLVSLHKTAAIQVTPNSPCASLCIDSSTLDTADPGSSTTVGADIVCADADFASTAAGQKWTLCLSCLQTSTFAQGSESDQAWFFYNLRYNVDYCVFGYPNATGAGSSPCQTSTACGPLQDALYDGIPAVGDGGEYEYCTVDSSAMTSSALKSCSSCVASSEDSVVLANSLVALEAGCQQQLAPSEAVGLSDSIFSTASTVSIVSPTAAAGSSSSSSSASASSSSSQGTKKTTIVVIGLTVALALLAIVAFSFVYYRKHKARGGRNRNRTHNRNRKPEDASITFLHAKQYSDNRTGGIGPTKWATEYPSSHDISLPFGFQQNFNSMASLEEVARKTAPVTTTTSSSRSAHSDKSSRSSTGSLQASSHDKALQHQAAISLKHTQTQADIEIDQSLSPVGASAARLSAIAESPLPSPAFDTGAAAGTLVLIQPPQQARMGGSRNQLPRLQQLNTSFSPPTSHTSPGGAVSRRAQASPLLLSADTATSDGSRPGYGHPQSYAVRDSPYNNTPISAPSPSSATALLAYTSLPQPPSQPPVAVPPPAVPYTHQRNSSSGMLPYNPADYVNGARDIIRSSLNSSGVSPVSARNSRGIPPSPGRSSFPSSEVAAARRNASHQQGWSAPLSSSSFQQQQHQQAQCWPLQNQTPPPQTQYHHSSQTQQYHLSLASPPTSNSARSAAAGSAPSFTHTNLGLGAATMAARHGQNDPNQNQNYAAPKTHTSGDSYVAPPDSFVELSATPVARVPASDTLRPRSPTSTSTSISSMYSASPRQTGSGATIASASENTSEAAPSRRTVRNQSSRDNLDIGIGIGIVGGLPSNPSPHSRTPKVSQTAALGREHAAPAVVRGKEPVFQSKRRQQ